LVSREYDKMSATETAAEEEGHGYDYLLSMPISSLTKEKVELLKNEKVVKEKELEALLLQTPKQMWENDLDAILSIFQNTVSKQAMHLSNNEKLISLKKTNGKQKRKIIETEELKEEATDAIVTKESKPLKAKETKAKPRTTGTKTKVSESKTISKASDSTMKSKVEPLQPKRSVLDLINESKSRNQDTISASVLPAAGMERPWSKFIGSSEKSVNTKGTLALVTDSGSASSLASSFTAPIIPSTSSANLPSNAAPSVASKRKAAQRKIIISDESEASSISDNDRYEDEE
jgi:hypothetical protein